MFAKNQHIHFIGIGGIGMCGVAWLCLKRGCKITGSDVKPTRITKWLEKEGAQIYIGHKGENLAKPDLVVYSSAINFQNPELRKAIYSGMETWRRGEFLSELMKGKVGIAVAGSHGKTTTSSLVATMLLELGHDPTSTIGAVVDNFNASVLLGQGKYFVTEADESDGSFLSLLADYSIITNIDEEHLDFYDDMEHALGAYLEFANNVSDTGALVCCGDDANIKNIILNVKKRILTYGLNTTNTLYAKDLQFDKSTSEFMCIYKGKKLGNVKLNLPGEHNILNAMAAILLGLEIGLDFDDIKSAIGKYQGAERRFQIKAEIDDVLIVDDYAHHPTEIKETLKSCQWFGKKRIIAIFQPHRYTRTKQLSKEFAQSLVNIDFLILTDIYPASEQPIYGVTTKNIYDEVVKQRSGNVIYLRKESICQHLLKIVRSGDLVIIMGAGDINKLADEFIQKLKQKKECSVAAKI